MRLQKERAGFPLTEIIFFYSGRDHDENQGKAVDVVEITERLNIKFKYLIAGEILLPKKKQTTKKKL